MSERIKTLAGALLALFVVYGLFFSTPEKQVEITRPLTTEQGVNGYYALHQWIANERITVYSFRERFSRLIGNPAIAENMGNMLVTTLPYNEPLRASEIEPLDSWIERGNTLLVLATINDTPDWSMATASTTFVDDLEYITGLTFSVIEEESVEDATDDYVPDEYATDEYATDEYATDEYATGEYAVGELDETFDTDESTVYRDIVVFDDSGAVQEFEINPRAAHPLMSGITKLKAMSNFVSNAWRASDNEDELLLELATMQLTDTPIIWQTRQGDGHIIVVGSGSLLTNRMIAAADNRQFVANLIQYNLASGGTVIFDDLHQGLSSIYDPAAFYSDSRLHYTIYFILGFWFLYVVGSTNRLLDPKPESKVLRQSEFIEAVGGFINRRMSKTAAGLWIYRSWFNDLRRHMGLPLNGEPVWEELKSMTILDKRQLEKMQRQYHQLGSNQAVKLIDLHNTINEARKAIG